MNKINSDLEYSLVLSGGGALGIASLKTLKMLEENNIKYSEVIGTSIGAIIGSCVALGMKSNEIYKIFKEFSSVYTWIKFSFNGNSIIKKDKIEKLLKKYFQDKKISDTSIPLKIISTDISTGNTKEWNCNDDITIVDAILSSIAIPGIFEEITREDSTFVDGFLGSNLGVLHTQSNNIIAIDVLGSSSHKPNLPNNFFKTKNVLEMLEKSMRLLIINQTKSNIEILKLKNKSVNLNLFEINTSNFKTFDFHKHEELYKLEPIRII